MDNIITYAEETMDSFIDRSFSPVDSLVLSQLSYINFPLFTPKLDSDQASIRIADLFRAEYFEEMLHNVRDPKSNLRLLYALAASPRFRDIGINYYSIQNDFAEEKQFAAVTFFLDDHTAYVAFRGTDGTFVGWKEDFNMAFKSPVPSQTESLNYLETISSKWPGKLFVGGHSKGGNLAVYSAMMSTEETQKKILQVYSHDGPGFKADVLKGINFDNIKDRINKTLPQSSIIGMLLEQQEDYSVVKSSQLGIMQHDPFSWIVKDYQFQYLKDLTPSALYVDQTLSEWVENLSDSEREEFIDTLYDVLNTGEYTTISQFNENWKKNIPDMINAIKGLDPDKKIFIYSTLLALISLVVKNLSNPPHENGESILSE